MSSYIEILKYSNTIADDIRDWRRTIHRKPELGFEEEKTSALVRSVLTDLEIPFQTGVAKTGIVATIKGSRSATVGLRADMDALRIEEENGTDFDSEYPGVMHACGHDAHTAMLLGAASVLQNLAAEGKLPGTVRLLFQPSEEAYLDGWDDNGKSGARYMVEEGALDGLEVVFGLHVDHEAHTGIVRTRPGPLLAAVDDFKLVLKGKGGHASEPHLTNDVISASALVINRINHIVSRQLNPVDNGVISLGSIHSGTAENVIPTILTITGTIRSLNRSGRQVMRKALKQAASISESFGAEFELSILDGYPVTYNDPEATTVCISALQKLLGEGNVQEMPAILGSEDFSIMAERVPGCFMFLGVTHPDWEDEYPVHTPTFRIDENALPIGTASLVSAALEWLNKTMR
jgi:amidohydrolase